MPTYRTGPLTPDNLTQTAPQLQAIVTVDHAGPRPLTPEEFAGMVLGPGPQGLPELVEALLLRARECMAYGGYHYPLFTVGLGQLGLVAEAAIREHAERNGISSIKDNGKAKPMVSLIEYLRARGHLTPAQETYWTQVAELRNFLFHPEAPSAFPPGAILFHLTTLTEALVKLFPEVAHSTPSGDY